ncbi:MAG: site-specific DNA-methyltransferase [Verrucomicrobia bacterium]|jgi:adenine-specific DNA-methyltransferase|nr:site-specific DNA-methyltransferase [Verrucomicrobiota bacterium]
MSRKKSAPSAAAGESVASYKYPSKRKNNPPAGLAAQGVLKDAPKIRYEYNPHLPPALRSATDAPSSDELPELLAASRKRALSSEEAKTLSVALRKHEPWLEWSGKREKPWFEVEPVALHIHERVSTQAILRVVAREDVQRDLFADPQQSYAQAVQFYQHDVDWANRMILGDSLQVMASLARREDLAGKVQMIYLDPPYGIKFASNFQPQLGQRDVKDREQDLTREPEMVKAYRDTWTLGIHSYLAYLRDRLTMAKELLADTGSIFVQISDENLHRVRCLMDEVFGPNNFCCGVKFFKTTSQTAKLLPQTMDHLLWYAKDIEKVKTRPVFLEKDMQAALAVSYDRIEEANGHRRTLGKDERAEIGKILESGARLLALDNLISQSGGESTQFKVEFEGGTFAPATGGWKTNADGMNRLMFAGRLGRKGDRLRFARFFHDFVVTPVSDVWDDTVLGGFIGDEKLYVVQTTPKVIERCLLMTTDPGDLVLDPTCGSGTTAYVAEQRGRRWITCDTSRVALALARQRLMTARFLFYGLRELSAEDLDRNKHGEWIAETGEDGKPTGRRLTFKCKTVPHITLKSIARNTSLDPIFAKHEPLLAERLKELNAQLKHVTTEVRQKLAGKLAEKQKRDGKKSITEADRRRWVLPTGRAGSPLPAADANDERRARSDAPYHGWREWEAPFDTDPDWPKPLRDALTAYRAEWRAKMDEVNACIAANAEMEELVDKPEVVGGVVRVSGPFTMEGVIAVEDGLATPIGGAPEELENFGSRRREEADAPDVRLVTSAATEPQNTEAHLDKILRLLKASGVDFSGNKNQKFTRLEPATGALLLHAEGEWANGDKKERRVAVSVGPEVGNVTAYQVEEAVRAANRRGYDDLVFAGFGFDAAAQAIIEEASHPNLRVHMALIRPDVAMGDLLKTQPGSQLFTVFSAPRVTKPEKQPDGQFVLEVEGMDVYDPVSNTLFPTDKERIAAWFLDSDYDGRTFCICQAFFPDKSKWDKLAKALGATGAVAEEAFEALSGLRSLPFPKPPRLKKGEKWQVAVKVIDPRGNEGLRVVMMP